MCVCCAPFCRRLCFCAKLAAGYRGGVSQAAPRTGCFPAAKQAGGQWSLASTEGEPSWALQTASLLMAVFGRACAVGGGRGVVGKWGPEDALQARNYGVLFNSIANAYKIRGSPNLR